MSNITSFQELGAHTDDSDDGHDISEEDISDLQLGPTGNERPILVSTNLMDINKSGPFGYVGLNASNVSTNSTTNNASNNYFSFQQHSKETSSNQGANSLRSDVVGDVNNNNNNINNSSNNNRSHSLSPNNNRQLPQTDFAPRKGRLKYNASSWFELLRIKYLLFLISFLSFVAIITYFIIPRNINTWIEITVEKLQFPPKGQNNIQMSITGYLYVTNPNYLPIILESMKVDIYFNRTKQKHHNNKTINICKQTYLLSYTSYFGELQNEETYDYNYPFYVTLNKNITNKTLSQFNQYVANSCKSTGSYILRAHIYPQYQYTQTLHQIAFYTDTNANQGCQQPNQTSGVSSQQTHVSLNLI